MKLGVRSPHSELDGTMHYESGSLRLALPALRRSWLEYWSPHRALCVPISHLQLQHWALLLLRYKLVLRLAQIRYDTACAIMANPMSRVTSQKAKQWGKSYGVAQQFWGPVMSIYIFT